MFSSDDIWIEIEQVDGTVVLITVETPVGRGECSRRSISIATSCLSTKRMSTAWTRGVWVAGINAILGKLLVEPDVQRLVIQGATRSTGAVPASDPNRSSLSAADIQIELTGPFGKPVALARLLASNGLGLAEAHEAVTKLANDRMVNVSLGATDLSSLVSEIRSRGLKVSAKREEAA